MLQRPTLLALVKVSSFTYETVNVIAHPLDLQGVPLARWHLELDASLAADLVDADGVFQWFHPGDVVVIRVLLSPHDSGTPIFLARIRRRLLTDSAHRQNLAAFRDCCRQR